MIPTVIHVLGLGVTGQAVLRKAREFGIKIGTLDDADLIIASPGIPPWEFPDCDTEIISEIEFAYRLFQAYDSLPVLIGVTGTNGKTTVTSLISHILDIPYAGNIGVPLISFVSKQKKHPAIVVELSSYQLELCTTFTPNIAVFLTLSPDHLYRHKTMDRYIAEKKKVFINQTEKETLIYNQDDAFVVQAVKTASAKTIAYSLHGQDREKVSDMQLKGDHNIQNALAAYYVAKQMGLSDTLIQKKLQSFVPVEHRIEFVKKVLNRAIYNDSKSTNPESTVVAVQAFSQPIHLIFGGKDKGLDLDEFAQFLVVNVSSIVVFGEISDRFFKAVKAAKSDFPIFKYCRLGWALKKSFKRSRSGDILLFSPGCSSFDQYRNFEHRGAIFKDKIKRGQL